ncbi:MAG TPA: peptidoglycan DD-metalloendopeptidase family protein [Acidimicrobiia bacterium]|nr:peptidoglycan DD-metalloendopeptidase family protein [Acidimicrobiia bacterium]
MGLLRPLCAAAPAVALLCSTAPLAAAPPDPPTGWLRPVDGPVVRPFEEPASRYGPGHRGADLAAAPGTVVRAANDGVVSFAGPVAGTLHAVVAHGGDLRTSYSFLARVDVHTGQTVTRGDALGITGGTGTEHPGNVLHLGLRVGDRYVDPMQLFEPTDLTELVRLVPTDLPPAEPWSPSRERSALLDGLRSEGGGPGFVDKVLSGAADAGRAVVDGGAAVTGVVVRGAAAGLEQLTRAGVALSAEIARLAKAGWDRTALAGLTRDLASIAAGIRDWWDSRGDCSADSAPADGTGGSGHLLMAVAGINSATDDDGATFALDADALGYHADEVEYYSYARDHGSYDKRDTWGDLLAAGRRLGEQLKAMHAANPGREVDLVAHSQGGVVVDVFLQHVYDASDPAYPPIGTVVTLASPHQGAPLATVAGDVRSNRTGRAVLDVAETVLPLPPSAGASTRQLAEGSELMNDLWAHRLPDHVDFTSIGGADDFVVPAGQIDVPGGTEVVVDVGGINDHSAIPADPRALQVVRAALEGRPPPCVGMVEGLRGAIDPVVITRVEHTVGDVARIAP